MKKLVLKSVDLSELENLDKNALPTYEEIQTDGKKLVLYFYSHLILRILLGFKYRDKSLEPKVTPEEERNQQLVCLILLAQAINKSINPSLTTDQIGDLKAIKEYFNLFLQENQ